MSLSRAYGGVTLMCGLITGNYLISSEYERVQRMEQFNHDFMDFNFQTTHQREIGDDCANMGYPDDGNGRYMKVK